MLVDLRRPLTRLVQIAMAELDQVLGHAGRGVGEERQNVDFGVPEIVALVTLPGEPLGRDPHTLCPRRGLTELVDVEPDRLLHPRIAAHSYIAPVPEVVEEAALAREQRVKPVLQRPRHRPFGAVAEFADRRTA